MAAFRQDLIALVSGGAHPVDLEALLSLVDVENWVYREMKTITTRPELDEWAKRGGHLSVLLTIFRAHGNKIIFTQALSVFAECVARASDNLAGDRRRKPTLDFKSTEWVLRAVLARLPETAAMPKPFLTVLFGVSATAALTDELRSKVAGMQLQEQSLQKECDRLAVAVRDIEATMAQQSKEIDGLRGKLADSESALREEKLHNERAAGFDQRARQEVANSVISRVRRAFAHRLENIRLLADRERPNRVEIVALAKELEAELETLESGDGE